MSDCFRSSEVRGVSALIARQFCHCRVGVAAIAGLQCACRQRVRVTAFVLGSHRDCDPAGTASRDCATSLRPQSRCPLTADNVPPASGGGHSINHHAARQMVCERRSQRGDYVVAIRELDGKPRWFAPCFTELSLKDLLRVGLTHWAALTVSVDLVRGVTASVAGLQRAGRQRVYVSALALCNDRDCDRARTSGRDSATAQGHSCAAAAAAQKVPPQVVLPEPETTTPDGKLSVSGAVSFAIVASGLVKVIVTVEAVPAFTVVGLKALLSEGARAPQRTVRVATAGELLLPLLVLVAGSD